MLLVNPAKLKSQNHTEKPQNFLIKLDLKKKTEMVWGEKKTLMRMQKFTTELFLEKKRKEKKRK